MQTRTMRAYGIAAIGLLTALASPGAFAQTPNTPRPETSLLGIRLLASYSDVLHKFGQPNEIQVGDPTVSGQGIAAANSGMSPGMGGRGMGGPMMGMGRPGMGGPPMGMMGSSMPPGMGMPPMGSSMGGPMMGKGGLPGMGGPPMGSSMGRPGIPGMNPGGGMPQGMMGSSMPPGMGMPSMGGPMMGAGRPGMGAPMMGSGGYPGMTGRGLGANTVEDSGETTWWYHFPNLGLHYSFLFNKEGKVIQIQAYGQKPSPKVAAPRSAEGITLGSDFGQVLRKYGWSNDGEHVGDYVVMRYGKVDRIAFQSRANRVLGIVLGRVRPDAPNPGAGMTGGYPGGVAPGSYSSSLSGGASGGGDE